MTIFKNIKDGKLYILYKGSNKTYLALPFEHKGHSISNCDVKEFIPVRTVSRLDGFV